MRPVAFWITLAILWFCGGVVFVVVSLMVVVQIGSPLVAVPLFTIGIVMPRYMPWLIDRIDAARSHERRKFPKARIVKCGRR